MSPQIILPEIFSRQEHVKKHGEVVQFLCQYCNASLSTQSQFRKHLKMAHNKTIDIMGNVIDSSQELKERKEREKIRRKRRSEDPLAMDNSPNKKRRRNSKKTVKEEETEEFITSYEDFIVSSNDDPHESGTVVYEETIPIAESEQMYKNSELMETQNGFEIIENSGSVMTVIQQQPQHDATLFNDFTTETFVVDNSPPAAPPLFVSSGANQLISGTAGINQLVSGTSGANQLISGTAGVNQLISAAGSAPVMVASQSNPLIFVVPNTSQSSTVTTGAQVRKPVIVTDQKKPIIIQSSNTGAADMSKINQGVIAQINGQKVLLVPKKKENVEATIKSAIQKIQPLTKVTSAPAPVLVTQKVVVNKVSGENEENDVENNQITAADLNNSILEQAMQQVFPSLEADTEKEENESKEDVNHQMRSPLKNRNKILCEVGGIDS